MLLAAAIALALAACGQTSTVTSIAGPTSPRCQAALSAQPTTVPHQGGTVTLTVQSERDCTWTASSEVPWIGLSATSGQGDGSLIATVAENEQPSPRTGAIAVNQQRLTVSQEPRPCTYELGSSRTQVPARGGTGRVELVTIAGCEWTATTEAGWIRIVTASGSGSGTIEFEVSANDGGARQAVIAIGNQRFVVEQDAVKPPCTYAIRPGSQQFGERGGDGRFRVETQEGCEWSASGGAGWVTVLSGRGAGSGDVLYIVQTNPDPVVRSTTITAGGQTHAITQEAANRLCEYAISPTSRDIPASGGEGSFQVSAQAACLWSATSGASWVSVRAGAPGGGSAEVRYVVQPNTSTSSRTTTVSVAGLAHTVRQAGATGLVQR